VWADRLDVPLGFIRGTIAQLLAGQCIDTRARTSPAERDRLADETRGRLDPSSRDEFEAKLRLARNRGSTSWRTTNFYIEHWGMSLVWRQAPRPVGGVREGRVLERPSTTIFFLRTDEIDAALWDMLAAWANESPALVLTGGRPRIERRKAILEACAGSGPPPALGIRRPS